MIEREICETYNYTPSDFDENGRRKSDGMTFRNLIKDFERDFHNRHPAEYALNLYAKSQTMNLLARVPTIYLPKESDYNNPSVIGHKLSKRYIK